MRMRNQTHTSDSESQNPLFTVVGTRRRRSILKILRDQSAGISEHELARTLTAHEQERTTADIPNDEAGALRRELRHTHLPLLEDYGLATWENEEATITATEHGAFSDPLFQQLLAVESEELDTVLAALSNKRRRRLLAILRDDRTPISQTALARAIAQRETDESAPSQAVIDEIMVALAHSHLPTLRDANLITYEAETGRVTHTEHAALEDLLRHLYKPDNRLITKLDGFFGDLLTSYRQASQSSDALVDWPNFWSESHHG